MTTSSCRPNRLLRFEDTTHVVSDSVQHRAGRLADALETYQSNCGGPYRIPTEDTSAVIRAWCSSLRDLGTWTGDIGRAFVKADAIQTVTGTREPTRAEAIDAFMKSGITGPAFINDPEAVVFHPDQTIRSHLPPSQQPHRGVPAGMAAQLALDLGQESDQDGPPAWIAHLNAGGQAAGIAENLIKAAALTLADLPPTVSIKLEFDANFVTVLRNGTSIGAYARGQLDAQLRLPTASAPKLLTAAKWIAASSHALAFTTSAATQWNNDAHLPTNNRLARTATRGLAVAGGGWAAGLRGS